jgi:hypothetical protein
MISQLLATARWGRGWKGAAYSSRDLLRTHVAYRRSYQIKKTSITLGGVGYRTHRKREVVVREDEVWAVWAGAARKKRRKRGRILGSKGVRVEPGWTNELPLPRTLAYFKPFRKACLQPQAKTIVKRSRSRVTKPSSLITMFTSVDRSQSALAWSVRWALPGKRLALYWIHIILVNQNTGIPHHQSCRRVHCK